MDIGFIGLGAMGTAMARNLAAAGHRVRAWNRSGGSVEGVEMVTSPAEAFVGDAVLTMLSEDAAIREVLLDSGVLDGAPAGVVHLVCSTISVAFARELVERHDAAGVGYLSAPVLGRPDVAAAGQLNVILGGPAGHAARLEPVFEAIAGKVWDMGEDATVANAAKIACNMMITMAIEGMAEAVVLTEGKGLPREKFFELMLGTLFGSRVYQNYSGIIAERKYEPGFKAVLGLKDLRLARELAAETAIGTQGSLPMLDAVHARMGAAIEAGHADRDWGIMAEYTIGTAKG
ncbi:NAD(P)-dependent oxidoreductase [Novosphingobium sp. ST904]|uniref:NAD(P)-dependent oxidoreductase n=1 Tax=Novosphingobium sp. ST904 TaxID=1684385 RepID=UPI0006C8A6F9|nr:NAD(P)-dependent oxidoreductase [Novosphingobium sp. ST904]KPH60835.1 oxidoreductase [Novosphingobium sp. ST904]TCM38396.1 3-hydroxyisobutyrate dehydrogenase-like beta-hydroxyacid dehydrogenase [Novosphingobium sp. ST904]